MIVALIPKPHSTEILRNIPAKHQASTKTTKNNPNANGINPHLISTNSHNLLIINV
jgi:hypothetical protein